MSPLVCYLLRMPLSPSHLPFNAAHINSCHTHSSSSYMSSLLTFSSHYDSTVLNHMTEHSYNKFHMHIRQPVKLSGHIVIWVALAKKRIYSSNTCILTYWCDRIFIFLFVFLNLLALPTNDYSFPYVTKGHSSTSIQFPYQLIFNLKTNTGDKNNNG